MVEEKINSHSISQENWKNWKQGVFCKANAM